MKKVLVFLCLFLFPIYCYAEEINEDPIEKTPFLTEEVKEVEVEKQAAHIEEIEGKKYYINENGEKENGFIVINDKLYFFSRANGALKTGWQEAQEGVWYQNSEGEVVKGIYEIEGKKYYFNQNGIQEKGFKTINNKLYFFSRVNGALKTGWQEAQEGVWYQNSEGEVVKGIYEIEGKKYYFNQNGIQEKGFKTIDNKLYFFSRANGALKTGWQEAQEGKWYQNSNGEVITGSGIKIINGKEYYLIDNYAQKGIIEIEGKKYYFDENTNEKRYGTVIKKYCEYNLDKTSGEYINKQYIPAYYMQKDSKWNNKKYGVSTLGKTGCAPSSMAMAFTSIKEREILPPEVASYLYNNTNQYNKRMAGTSGLGIIYASEKYNVKYQGISTKEELINELSNGRIVFAAMGNGKFATLKWNHAIVLYRYNKENETTYVHDPLNRLNNGYVKIDTIWKEKSNDPDDLLGGYALYSLYE